MRGVALLGSTGSIGRSTLAVLPTLARECVARGLAGLEWAVGVPGTLAPPEPDPYQADGAAPARQPALHALEREAVAGGGVHRSPRPKMRALPVQASTKTHYRSLPLLKAKCNTAPGMYPRIQ